MKKIFAGIFTLISFELFAQHDMHNMNMTDTVPKKDSMNMSMHDMHNMNMPGMSHAYSLSLPMNRNGSGTSWSPDNTPMYAIMKHGKKDMWMQF